MSFHCSLNQHILNLACADSRYSLDISIKTFIADSDTFYADIGLQRANIIRELLQGLIFVRLSMFFHCGDCPHVLIFAAVCITK